MISKLSSYLGPTSLFSGGLAPSLVLHLDAGNTFSYSGEGSTWYDLTSLNNDIELSNTTFNATYSNLINFKGSFEFNGTDSFGSLITGTAIPLMDSHYTIESWFQANSYETLENGGIIGWGKYGTDYDANALRQSGLGFTNYWWNSDLVATPVTASVDYWYYLAATYDGTNRTIYLNGQSIGTDIPGVSHSVSLFSNLTVGVTADYLDEYFNGKISTIKVWNKNLNSSQLLSAFNSNKSKYGYDFGSMTFNGTDSYLISSSSDYAFGTNDFTVELFFKSVVVPQSQVGIISSVVDGYPKGTPFAYIHISSGVEASQIILVPSSGGAGSEIIIDTWYHVAISRTSGTSSLFLNGNLIGVVSDTSDYEWSDLVIGRRFTNLDSSYFNGLISNVRVINGTGLYTGTFSIPDVQLGVTGSNTKLLISSQEMNPTTDLTGLHSVTASNIGWTSSLPSIVAETISINLFFNRITTLTINQINNIAQDVPTIKLLRYLSTGEIAQTTSIIANNTYEYDGSNQFSTTIDETTFLNALIDGEYYIVVATSNYLVGYQPRDPYQISGGGYFLKWNSSTGLFTSAQNSSPGPGAVFLDYNPGDKNYRSFNPSSTIIELLGSLPRF
jgi:hypothetical protein